MKQNITLSINKDLIRKAKIEKLLLGALSAHFTSIIKNGDRRKFLSANS